MSDGRTGRSSVLTLYLYEGKMLLRDKRTIFFSIILPVVLLPLILILANFVEERQEERFETSTIQYAVSGDTAELGRQLVAEALSRPTPDDSVRASFEEVPAADPDSALRAGDLLVLVETLSPERAAAQRDSAARAEAVDAGEDAEDGAAAADGRRAAEAEADVPLLKLHYRGNSDTSSRAARRLRDRLLAVRDDRRDRVFRAEGLPIEPEAVLRVEYEDTASPERATGAVLGMALTPLLVLLMLTGGAVVAADAISGEKERGTLETMLTTAARRSDIVAAKQLLIVSVAFAITAINVLNLLVYVVIGVFELPADFAVSLPPASLGLLLLLYLPLTLLLSSVLLLVSGYVQSYKEFQIYFFPVFLLLLLPAAASALPGIELRSGIVLIPVANVSVAVREVLLGEYDWLFLGLTLAVTTGAAMALARVTTGFLSTERLITAAHVDQAELTGGPALFPRRVLRWFATLWAVFFIASLLLGGELDIRLQVSINLVLLFLGGSLLMIWRYRLDPKQALALRPVKPAVWLAVIIGVPSAFIVATGIFQLADFIFPVPDEVLEAFSQYLLPEDIPFWQILFFLALLPGICEEIAFRGVLLYGLHRKLHPAALVAVVGAIFGFFHVELFRLIPTAYLGAVLAAVTLLTGSIFPAMAWHALNNAFAFVATELGWAVDEPSGGVMGAAVAGLVLAFWILWRNRMPYPGLRPWNAKAKEPAEPERMAAT